MEEREFAAAVRQYERLVYTICFQFTRDHHAAEDLAQETFISAYTHMGGCPPEARKQWIAKIAVNKAKDYLKSAYSRRVRAAGEEAPWESGAVLFAREERPEELALQRDAVRRIAEDVRALREPYHKVAVLYFLEERTVEEIARRLERPPKTVHTQLYRARSMLRQKLEAAAEEERGA